MEVHLAGYDRVCQIEPEFTSAGDNRRCEVGDKVTIQSREWRNARILDPLRRVKRGLNQLLHPFRRGKALARVRALGRHRKILVVCTGNVCRSPYAEARLKEDAEMRGDLEVDSAGWMGAGSRVPPAEALAVAEMRGVDMVGHESQALTRELVRWADLILVMEAGQRRIAMERFGATDSRVLLLGDLDPKLPLHRSILDPMDRSLEFFDASFARIDRCVEVLLTLIKESA
jgi:protein-tyrosine phosphatase